MSRPRIIALLLALGTLVVFLPVGRFGFVAFDDNDYVTDNPFVKHGLTAEGLRWAFGGFHASNWHPLTWISHMTDCTMFGLNPGAHHFVNVLFHAVNAALLFTWLLRLTGRMWPAAFIAALFAWHPLHVESVAWISERKDVLSAFFALLALMSYTQYAQAVAGGGKDLLPAGRHSSRDYWLALGFFALGLLSKPMLVTLPFVLLLLDFWPLNRIAGCRLKVESSEAAGFQPATFNLQLVTEKIPFFLLAAVSCVVTFLAQRNGESIISLTKVPLTLRLENAPVAAVGYLQNFLRPDGLCAIYPMPDKIPADLVASSVTILILISAGAWHWRKAKPYLLTGWLWFLGTLVPVIGLVQVGGQAMADRYTYIPSIGFFIAVVFLLDDFAKRLQAPNLITAGAAAVILAGCTLVTEYQLQFWRNSETLFRRAIAVTQNNDIALINLGVALDAQGRFDEALVVYRQAEKIAPGRYQLHNNLGNILGILGRHEESLAEYREAIRLRPDNARLHNAAGDELVALGRYTEALDEYREAGRLNPDYASPHAGTAKALFKLGRDAEGVEEFRAALRIEPGNYQTLATAAHYLAASENAATRDGKSALTLALEANERAGHTQPMVWDILGMAYAACGDFTDAAACAENALTLANAVQMKNIGPLQKRLELYQKQQPWRESFHATNAPVKE